MPQKAQLLLQLAQAAAKVESRQQNVLPQVVVNAWDAFTGGHAVSVQQPSARTKGTEAGARQSLAHASDRLVPSFGLLQLGNTGAGSSQSQLLAQQAAALHAWGAHSVLSGTLAADTAALYDNNGWHAPHHSVPASLLSGSGIAGLPGPVAAAGLAESVSKAASGCSSSNAAAPLLGGGAVRKPRFNNSISLNKQIMNTHSTRDLHAIVRTKGSMFDFFNISSAIARVPKLVGPSGNMQSDATAKALVDDLASLMASHINTFDARGLANSAWAFGKLKYTPNQKLPALIASAAIDKLGSFSAQNLSNLLWSFVYLHYRNEQLMTAVSKQVVKKIGEFKPQELANVVWALASMEHYDSELMEVAGRTSLTMVDQFKEQELSNVVWAFAKLHHYDQDLFERLLAAVSTKLPHFLPQGVSNVAWALATAGHHDDVLFEQLLQHCMADISAFDVQGLSNLLWACATLGYRDSAFVSAATRECTQRIERMSSQNLSNVLWACATLGHVDSRVLGNWAEAVMHKLDMFEPQGLSNSAWAFAKLGFSSPILFEALAEAALGKLELFTAQGLSNTAWAYATVGHYHPVLMQQLAEQVMHLVGSFSTINCSNTAWAFATLRHYHPAMFDALLERLAGQMGSVEPQNIANVLYAVARVNHPLGNHTAPFVAAAKRLLPRMNQQELCNTVWALGVLGQLDKETWEHFCACALNVQGLTPEGVHQAFHAQLMLHSQIARQAGVLLSALPADQLPKLPEPLASHARHMWLASAVDVHVSKLQTDVSSALLLAGVPNGIEWLTDDGLFSIDIAFEVDGQPVAVEVDGSHHYTNSLPHLPLSEVLVRRRLLEDRGWKVLNVGYLDWEALPDDMGTKAAALLQLLSSQLGPVSSWQSVDLPSREPGSLVADAEAAQAAQAARAAAAALAAQQREQQKRLLMGGWQANGGLFGGVAASSVTGLFCPVGAIGSSQPPAGLFGTGVSAPAAGGLSAGGFGQLGCGWGSLNAASQAAASTGMWDGRVGLETESVRPDLPAGLGMWGSGSMTSLATLPEGPSLLQQLQQLAAWDAFLGADTSTDPSSLAAPGAVHRTSSGCSTSSAAAQGAGGLEGAQPSPRSDQQTGSKAVSECEAMGGAAPAAEPTVLPAADEVWAALTTAQQQWNSSPSSSIRSSGNSSSGGGVKGLSPFLWGDPVSGSIWSPLTSQQP